MMRFRTEEAVRMKANLFIPSQHRPKLPMDYEHGEDPENYHISFQDVAWHAYWDEVFKLKRKHKVGVLRARELFHAKGKLPRRAERYAAGDERYWSHDDMLVAFMLQFEKWQTKGHNLQQLHDQARLSGCLWEIGRNNPGMCLESYICTVDHYTRCDLPAYLKYCNRFDDMKSLFDDPIWGDDMKFEYDCHQDSQASEINEMMRIAQSHPHIQEIDAILRKGNPSLYNVNYPWPKNPYHQIDNCLFLSADGSMLARIEVLDTEGLMRFKLHNLAAPWWGLNRGLGEKIEPWEGEYDFDFHHFNINEGDEFTYEKFLEVLMHGMERIRTRGKRKWGRESD